MDHDMDDPQQAWTAASVEGPTVQAAVLVDLLAADPTYADTTAARMGTIITGLAARHETLGRTSLSQLGPADAAGFVTARTRRGARPSPATMHLRRTAVRLAVALIAELEDRPAADPTVGLRLPPRQTAGHQPLAAAELPLLRLAAASRTRRRGTAMATVALSEAGATTGEVARLCWVDIDLDRSTVDLPGAGRTVPRLVELTPWGRRALADHHAATRATPPDPVVYRGGADPTSDTAQAAVTTRLRNLLAIAGITDGVRPGSVRLCLPAARLAEDGQVAVAARRLGLTSLDVTARLCAWDWTT